MTDAMERPAGGRSELGPTTLAAKVRRANEVIGMLEEALEAGMGRDGAHEAIKRGYAPVLRAAVNALPAADRYARVTQTEAERLERRERAAWQAAGRALLELVESYRVAVIQLSVVEDISMDEALDQLHELACRLDNMEGGALDA